jgi:hypothetical protein
VDASMSAFDRGGIGDAFRLPCIDAIFHSEDWKLTSGAR